jgi:hypothetical protein
MARAHRVGAGLAILTVIYILAFFQIIGLPFVSEATAAAILPVVCHLT